MNIKRREFLKLTFYGFIMLIFSKFFPKFLEKREAEFKNFRVKEEGEKLIFYNKHGEKVFVLKNNGMEIG